MNTKQTAVEWLFEQVDNLDWKHLQEEKKIEILDQAKAMEKQQIIQAVFDSMGTNFDPNMGRAEQYYNETFKSE